MARAVEGVAICSHIGMQIILLKEFAGCDQVKTLDGKGYGTF